jgi:hypothetical protein
MPIRGIELSETGETRGRARQGSRPEVRTQKSDDRRQLFNCGLRISDRGQRDGRDERSGETGIKAGGQKSEVR